MKITGGLDIGTTGCKIVLYDENAVLLDTYYVEYDSTHKNGEHEIDFGIIRDGVIQILKTAANKYEITALGITSFGESFVMLDENDNILAPSMLYTDPRGADECQHLCDIFGEDKLTLLTGVKPHCMYSIYKIYMLMRQSPDIFSRCKKILLAEDFIIYTLTGERKISYSLAARTGAFDIEEKCWITDIFDTIGLDTKLMSTPIPSCTVCGKISDKIKDELSINYSFSIINVGHDQIANMIGAGVFESNQAMDGTGTVECIPVILQHKPKKLEFYDGGYSVVPFLDNKYVCYALSFAGGATLKWFRDNFAEHEKILASKTGNNVYAMLDKTVKSEPTGILIMPHFSGAATPYMDNDSKAVFVGITLETDKSDIYKALMEGTSYEMLLNFSTLKNYISDIKEIRATGGGASSDVWLQIKADILECEITALDCNEVGASGAAISAGCATNIYGGLKEASAKIAPIKKVFRPNPENSRIYKEYYKKYANLYNTIKNL